MNQANFSIIYTTLFLVLSIALFFVKIPTHKRDKDYRKSRRTMGIGLLLVGILGLSRIIFPNVHIDDFTNFCFMLALCYIFTFLNYLSFLYMIETSHARRVQIMKMAVYMTPLMIGLFVLGISFMIHLQVIKIVLSCICILIHFFILTSCFREYDKFNLQSSNYFDDYPNISWIPTMLWATFLLACMTVGCFFFKPLIIPTGICSLIVYTYLPLKLLSIMPETIHIVRDSIENKDIIAEVSINEVPTIKEEEKEITQKVEPVSITEEKNAKRYEKIDSLVDKWIQDEKYTQPDINIKDAATQMGTNSYYLSTYINRVLNTTFAIWLNSLRIEKSKEYLMSSNHISVEECGLKVGYTNLYNYSRWFKSITGVSPLKWKKNN